MSDGFISFGPLPRKETELYVQFVVTRNYVFSAYEKALAMFNNPDRVTVSEEVVKAVSQLASNDIHLVTMLQRNSKIEPVLTIALSQAKRTKELIDNEFKFF